MSRGTSQMLTIFLYLLCVLRSWNRPGEGGPESNNLLTPFRSPELPFVTLSQSVMQIVGPWPQSHGLQRGQRLWASVSAGGPWWQGQQACCPCRFCLSDGCCSRASGCRSGTQVRPSACKEACEMDLIQGGARDAYAELL